MLLQDFASYCAAEQRMADTYARSEEWNRMSLINIARSGIFAAEALLRRQRPSPLQNFSKQFFINLLTI